MLRIVALVSVLFISLHSLGQSKAERKMIKALHSDISYLASDELEGRRTGTEGERKAGDYLIARYKELGIPSRGNSYRHPYTFIYGKQVDGGNSISINKEALSNNDAFPFPFSANKKVTADALPDVHEEGNVWLLPLYASEDEAKDAHFDWEKRAFEIARDAQKGGASGVVLYDSYDGRYPPEFNRHSEYESLNIPVVFLSYKAWGRFSQAADIPVVLDVHVKKPERTGTNIAAYLNTGSAYTVVLGAHYDHLGYGEDGGSLYSGKEHLIHHGADDNASGTAALLQLAGWLKKQKHLHYNYLFVNFSGEELGLLGSKAFIKEADMDMDSSHVAYMINLDMVGRLVDSTQALSLGGLGTSPAWQSSIDIATQAHFKVVRDSSGVGPSDHTSFYHKGIPVLFFFTGTHKDYHKPSDEADKINYPGEARVISCIEEIIREMDSEPKPVFTPTRQTSMGRVRLRVTLGIMPDYSYTDGGVRIDGVTEGKPAAAAGLRPGDVIIGLGKDKVQGMQSYMEALGRLKEGDHTHVLILRDGHELKIPVMMR